ncbi:hypothetical protein, partial [Escherichia coli]|uniref:hypothetical protein n=1 Tax=Escherichia coli TaxID=562 RepID=UPI00224F193B
ISCPTSVDRWVQAMGDAGRPVLKSAHRCVQATEDAARARPTSKDQCTGYGQCWKATSDVS